MSAFRAAARSVQAVAAAASLSGRGGSNTPRNSHTQKLGHCVPVCFARFSALFLFNRWEGNNGPRPTDYDGPHNLLKACPKSLKRFVFVTSAGVERRTEMPWAILNTFGKCGAAA